MGMLSNIFNILFDPEFEGHRLVALGAELGVLDSFEESSMVDAEDEFFVELERPRALEQGISHPYFEEVYGPLRQEESEVFQGDHEQAINVLQEAREIELRLATEELADNVVSELSQRLNQLERENPFVFASQISEIGLGVIRLEEGDIVDITLNTNNLPQVVLTIRKEQDGRLILAGNQFAEEIELEIGNNVVGSSEEQSNIIMNHSVVKDRHLTIVVNQDRTISIGSYEPSVEYTVHRFSETNTPLREPTVLLQSSSLYVTLRSLVEIPVSNIQGSLRINIPEGQFLLTPGEETSIVKDLASNQAFEINDQNPDVIFPSNLVFVYRERTLQTGQSIPVIMVKYVPPFDDESWEFFFEEMNTHGDISPNRYCRASARESYPLVDRDVVPAAFNSDLTGVYRGDAQQVDLQGRYIRDLLRVRDGSIEGREVSSIRDVQTMINAVFRSEEFFGLAFGLAGRMILLNPQPCCANLSLHAQLLIQNFLPTRMIGGVVAYLDEQGQWAKDYHVWTEVELSDGQLILINPGNEEFVELIQESDIHIRNRRLARLLGADFDSRVFEYSGKIFLAEGPSPVWRRKDSEWRAFVDYLRPSEAVDNVRGTNNFRGDSSVSLAEEAEDVDRLDEQGLLYAEYVQLSFEEILNCEINNQDLRSAIVEYFLIQYLTLQGNNLRAINLQNTSRSGDYIRRLSLTVNRRINRRNDMSISSIRQACREVVLREMFFSDVHRLFRLRSGEFGNRREREQRLERLERIERRPDFVRGLFELSISRTRGI